MIIDALTKLSGTVHNALTKLPGIVHDALTKLSGIVHDASTIRLPGIVLYALVAYKLPGTVHDALIKLPGIVHAALISYATRYCAFQMSVSYAFSIHSASLVSVSSSAITFQVP